MATTKSSVSYTALRESGGQHGDTTDTKGQVIWRITNGIMTIFFLLAAYANLNDSDAILWVPVYLLPSLLSLAIAVKPELAGNSVWRVVTVVHMTLCLAGAIYLMAAVVEMLMLQVVNPLQHEEGRELGGTLIIIAWLAVCRFSSLGSFDSSKGSISTLLLMTGVLAIVPLGVWGLCYIDPLHKHLGHCKDMF